MFCIRSFAHCAYPISSDKQKEKKSDEVLKMFTDPPEHGAYVMFCHFATDNSGFGHSALNVYDPCVSPKLIQSVNFVAHKGINGDPSHISPLKSDKFYFIPVEKESVVGFKEWYQERYTDRNKYSLFFNNCATAARDSMTRLGIDLGVDPWIDQPNDLVDRVEGYIKVRHQELLGKIEASRPRSFMNRISENLFFRA